MAKNSVCIFMTYTSNKSDSDICSLDITKKHRRRVRKTLPSNKNTLKTRN